MDYSILPVIKMNELIYRMKKAKWIRIMSFPIINIIRVTRLIAYQYTTDAKKIRCFQSKFDGERCFIIGNGPSLIASDLDILKNEHCFAANKIYKIFDDTVWRPEFYFCADSFVLNDCKENIKDLKLPNIFIQLEGKKHHLEQDNSNVIYINNYYPFLVNRYKRVKGIKISKDVAHHFAGGETVTFTAIQMAIYMGFKKIYLLGVDHNYSQKIDSKGNLTTDPSIKDYFGNIKTESYNIQSYETTNAAYQVARDFCDKNKIKIYNATRGGKLEVFERADFDSVISASEETEAIAQEKI